MVKELSRLNKFIKESVKPTRLAATELTEQDFQRWSEFVNQIADSLRQDAESVVGFTSHGFSRKLYPVMSSLVSIINTANSYIYNKALQGRPDAQKIVSFYKYTCEKLESLLSTLRDQTAYSRLKVSDFTLREIKMELIDAVKDLALSLTSWRDETGLNRLVPEILMRRIRKRNLTWHDVREIRDAIADIGDADISSSDELFRELVAIDFDFPEILLYQVELWRGEISDVADLRGQIAYATRERHRISEIILLSRRRRSGKKSQLGEDLVGYLNEYEQFLMQMIAIQQATERDAIEAKADRRFPVNLSVPQLGLFIRLQIERGILPKENLSQLFSFFAEHFYTANARFISPESLQKKSTDIEFTTAQKMKGQLIGMINWLNTNYNLSNYS